MVTKPLTAFNLRTFDHFRKKWSKCCRWVADKEIRVSPKTQVESKFGPCKKGSKNLDFRTFVKSAFFLYFSSVLLDFRAARPDWAKMLYLGCQYVFRWFMRPDVFTTLSSGKNKKPYFTRVWNF